MRFYGPHGTSKEFLASGAPIPDGDFFDLTRDEAQDPHNARLIEEGKILEVEEDSPKRGKRRRLKGADESEGSSGDTGDQGESNDENSSEEGGNA